MVKLSFRVLPEQNEQFSAWAAELGMTKSNFLALASLLGAKALMRQVSPEKFITPDLIQTMQAAGFGLPEEQLPKPSLNEVVGNEVTGLMNYNEEDKIGHGDY